MMINKQERKETILTHYGNGKLGCVNCGFGDIRALSVDHIEGHGNFHRGKALKSSGTFYSWLIKNNLPEGFQTLCMNCQFIKRSENREDYWQEWHREARIKELKQQRKEEVQYNFGLKLVKRCIRKSPLRFTAKQLIANYKLPEDKYPQLRVILSRLVADGLLIRLDRSYFEKVISKWV